MLYQYDKALVSKFKSVFDRVVYAPTDKFYERYLLENNNDKIELPAISIWRTSHEFQPYDSRTQLRIPNDRRLLSDTDFARQVFSMKIVMNYQLDIWAGSDVDRDDFLKEILYFITMYPNVPIEYQGFKYEFPVLMLQPPDDVTDITDFESTGDMYRVSVPLSIPDARIFFYQDVRTCKFINLSFYVNNELEDHIKLSNKKERR